jgi:DNA-directed RNA polymerase specialized sigma24 family protein
MAKRSQDQMSAFADLVEARSTAMVRLAFAVVGDYQLAQDLLQESLVKSTWPGRGCGTGRRPRPMYAARS